MGAREGLLIAVAVLAVYLVFQLIRAMSVKDGSAAEGKEDEAAAPSSAADVATTDEAAGDDGDDAVALSAAAPADSAAAGGDFGLALEVRQLRRDAAQLRGEVDHLRAELLVIRQSLSEQAAQLDATRAAQRVSPLYGEALALVRRGMTAEDIAERCSISVAEAELVKSLGQDPAAGGEDTR
ncbi:DUF2802 domain-containing protein [Denitromonas iodatirespirans]|uniref:DUF2802 domain-containing protein n=1 Tax=Denitromonas iodatirespirans TaxID=2795389 RepID=A0A944DC88_DENI1|nr:DUF2802 domain-containing protein [Denitromonas iodatirespirans]MBT0962787.1 DUF2802 domain-containing protein [Denitromonas iodatirespirans]